jgi:ATP synthase protein I
MSPPRREEPGPGTSGGRLRARIARKQASKLRARRKKNRSVWFGLGMFGLVGWSVAIPTLIGVGLGMWIDATWPSRFSWTLMLMLPGLVIGCLTAWYWISQERTRIEAERKEDDDE